MKTTTPRSIPSSRLLPSVLLVVTSILVLPAIGESSGLQAQTPHTLLAERFDANARLTSSGTSTSAWYYSGNVSEIDNSTDGSLSLDTGSGARTVLTHFSDVDLALGESLSVSFSFSGTVGSSTSARSFRFGLFDSNDAALISADGFGNVFEGYTGYMMALNTTTSAMQGGRVTSKASGNNILSTGQADSFGSNAPDTAFVNDALYTASLTITRVSLTDVSITFGIVGEGLTDATRTWSTTNRVLNSFNTFAIGTGNTDAMDVLTLHSVDITHTSMIPEHASFGALLGAGACFVALGTRRR